MGLFSRPKKSRQRAASRSNPRRRTFETLEDRRVMAVLTGASTFDPHLMGDIIEELSAGNAVGFGYAINAGGQVNVAVGSGGQARTVADLPVRNFTSLTELEVSSVSKTITATAILHNLQSRPGGLDAALSTRLVDYLPSDWNPGANLQHVTLRHLLTHRSGLLEEGNAIGVNFESYGNNTFANLQALVEAGLPAPTVAADDVYDAPRWGNSYNNANFSLLAKVVLPKLINASTNLTATVPLGPDLWSGSIYKNYVKTNIFDPMGITGADMIANQANPAVGYNLATANTNSGLDQWDLTNTGGAFGWKLTARELGTFLDAIENDNSILWASTRQMRDAQELGWFRSTDAFGDFFSHNGSTGAGSGNFRSRISSFPGNIQASYLMNSESDNLPGGSIGQVMKTAYVNAWTDLTVGGTSGDDDFIIRLDNSGLKPSVEVVLNGDVQFTHWVSTLDTLTLNGGWGNDTFTIEGWNPAIDLTINGGWGDDVVHVLPGVRNLEFANGLTFNGGLGSDTLHVHDESNPYSNVAMSRIYTVSDSGISRFRAHPAFPGNPGMFLPVTIAYEGVENVDLRTGALDDVVNVVSVVSGEMDVRTGNGNDVITVGATAGNLEQFDGLKVHGGSGVDTIRLHDHNKTSANPLTVANYDVDNTSVSRYTTQLDSIFALPPTPVEVEFSLVENLELTTTDMVDNIRVHRTTSGQTTINGGAGNDRLFVTPNGKNIELAHNLQFNGDAGIDSIVIDDRSNPYSHFLASHIYDVSSTEVERGKLHTAPIVPIVLGSTPVTVGFASVEDLTLRTGAENDTVRVESTPWTRALIQTGEGDDVILASPQAKNMENVDGLIVDGGAGNDQFHVSDENNPYELPGGAKYTIDSDSIGRYEEHLLFDNFAVPIDVQFANVENVSLAAGNLGDEFKVEGDAGVGTLTLDGNSGADKFHIRGPAFEQINIQGDAPIFAPGDQLIVNEDALYATTSVPGLYLLGSGQVTLDASTISYAGIETVDLQQQIYGTPGDFDSDGDVDDTDLTHALLGWNERFGSDLSGSDFLAWQRNLGNGPLQQNPHQAPSRVDSNELAFAAAMLDAAADQASAVRENSLSDTYEQSAVESYQAVDTGRFAALDAAFADLDSASTPQRSRTAPARRVAWNASVADRSLEAVL
jgi:CubicO group peptidase (beta-lactamase class C family)